jgi:hypothetical protein
MPFEEPKTVNPNKVLPMSPDRTVTHVPGLDQMEAATVGSGDLPRLVVCVPARLLDDSSRPTTDFPAIIKNQPNSKGEGT